MSLCVLYCNYNEKDVDMSDKQTSVKVGISMVVFGLFSLGFVVGAAIDNMFGNIRAKKAQEARVKDSLTNTVEYKQALEMYQKLTAEQKQLLQESGKSAR